MNKINHTFCSLICVFVVLLASALFHFLYPDIATAFLCHPAHIQTIGIMLSILGLWVLLSWVKTIGVLVLVSGLTRWLSPEIVIGINDLNNKYTHGVLLGIAALLVMVVLTVVHKSSNKAP